MWINLMRAYLKFINNRQMVQNRKYTSGFINAERSSYTSAADKSFFIEERYEFANRINNSCTRFPAVCDPLRVYMCSLP